MARGLCCGFGKATGSGNSKLSKASLSLKAEAVGLGLLDLEDGNLIREAGVAGRGKALGCNAAVGEAEPWPPKRYGDM